MSDKTHAITNRIIQIIEHSVILLSQYCPAKCCLIRRLSLLSLSSLFQMFTSRDIFIFNPKVLAYKSHMQLENEKLKIIRSVDFSSFLHRMHILGPLHHLFCSFGHVRRDALQTSQRNKFDECGSDSYFLDETLAASLRKSFFSLSI